MKPNIIKKSQGALPMLALVFPFFLLLYTAFSCDNIEVEDPNFQLTGNTVFNDDATAEAAIVGIYSSMASSEGYAGGGYQSLTLLAGLSADEFDNYSYDTNYGQFYNNALLPTNSWLEFYLWNEAYNYIYQANSILEGLANSSELSPALKERLIGEASFVRAFNYFYLVNLFGEVPLVTSTDYQVNKSLSRSDIQEVYDQIIEDLETAQDQLPEDYGFSGNERIRPNKWAATAMLARVYLYLDQWDQAEVQATSVIDQTDLYSLPDDLNSIFLKNSSEAIWQLAPVIPNINTKEGRTFILNGPPYYTALSSWLIEDFNQEDLRSKAWIDSLETGGQVYYYPYKYKVSGSQEISEYSMVLRLAEQYLIRAEARAHLNDLDGALEDLNRIRVRAGLSELEDLDQEAILLEVQRQRRLEFFGEWGHRWLDLKRTNSAGEVLAPIKEDWQATDVLYPIPQSELQDDPNLTQNPGY